LYPWLFSNLPSTMTNLILKKTDLILAKTETKIACSLLLINLTKLLKTKSSVGNFSKTWAVLLIIIVALIKGHQPFYQTS
jgi:hypothetical protein